MSHPLETIVANGQCIGCGFCAATFRDNLPETSVAIEYDEREGIYRPVVRGWSEEKPTGTFICPGSSMDMPSLSELTYQAQPSDVMTGIWKDIRAVASTDVTDRKQAASGGAVPAILRHLFETGAIDCTYCVITPPGSRDGYGAVLTSVEDLRLIHGSVYHPADFGRQLRTLFEGEGRFAFVGLPCEVAALRQVLADRPDIRERCVAAISIFCGGINRFDGIAYYLAAFDLSADRVRTIRYREGDWPGSMAVGVEGEDRPRVVHRIHGNTRWRILRYMAAFQGPWMLKRCRICPDQIGDFADIAVGDPHLPRFRALAKENGGQGYSAIITRTDSGEAIVVAALKNGALQEVPLSRDELVASQGYTLENRRQARFYAEVEQKLGGVPPSIVPYHGIEDRVRLQHRLSAFLDLIKLRAPKGRVILAMLPFWQAFEYLFLRFPLLLLGNRLMKLLRNR